MLFTSKTVRRIMFPRQKYENFGSLAPLARNDLFFFASFWFSGLYKSLCTRPITSTDKLCDSPTKYCEECKNTQNSARLQKIAFSRRKSTKISARSLRSLAVISGYISRFWFSGRHNEQDHITSVTNTRT